MATRRYTTDNPVVTLLTLESPGVSNRNALEPDIEASVGCVEDRHSNALSKAIKELSRAEVIHRRGQRRSFEAVKHSNHRWDDWFNNRSLFEPIETIPPQKSKQTSTPVRK